MASVRPRHSTASLPAVVVVEDSAEFPPRSQRERRIQQRARHPIQRRSGSTSSGESSYQGNWAPIIEVNEEQHLQPQYQGNRVHPLAINGRRLHNNQEQHRPRPPLQRQVVQLHRDLPRRPLQQPRIPLPYQHREPSGVGNHRANHQQQQLGMRPVNAQLMQQQQQQVIRQQERRQHQVELQPMMLRAVAQQHHREVQRRRCPFRRRPLQQLHPSFQNGGAAQERRNDRQRRQEQRRQDALRQHRNENAENSSDSDDSNTSFHALIGPGPMFGNN